MGTETHYPIGTIFTRREPKGDSKDELIVTGGGKQLIVTSNLEFGPSWAADAAELRAEYEDDAPENTGLQPTTGRVVSPGLAPEEVFAQMATEQQTKRRGRQKKTEDEVATA